MILQRLTAKRVHRKNWSFPGRCIESHFWRDDRVVIFRVFPNHDVFTLFFRNHFRCFFASFFFLKVHSKIGVRIINGCALYTGKYGNCYYHHHHHGIWLIIMSVINRKWECSPHWPTFPQGTYLKRRWPLWHLQNTKKLPGFRTKESNSAVRKKYYCNKEEKNALFSVFPSKRESLHNQNNFKE